MVLVNPRAQEEIEDAKRRIAEAGRPADPPHVVAALDLGFWSGLCNREYEQGPAMRALQIALWPSLLRPLGAALPRELRRRQALSEFLGRVRIIRNRAYHHEPVRRGQEDRRGTVVALTVDHARMRDLVRSLGPRIAPVLDLCDRFPDVYDRGHGPWTEAVKGFCLDSGYEP